MLGKDAKCLDLVFLSADLIATGHCVVRYVQFEYVLGPARSFNVRSLCCWLGLVTVTLIPSRSDLERESLQNHNQAPGSDKSKENHQ